ncbi:FAD-dependent monooxygenase [Actinomadura sp. NPDC048021]|uniref:FAD-dependent monooxygenase n=1 Tax=Actinomadura sp. NPDC048021 TaxID=3155385 RepID=UPI0033C0EAAB
MTASLRTDVLVVGRGPVGMTLALLLARYGVASTVVDPADREIRLSSKAVLMHGESLEILAKVGVGDAIGRTGVRLSGSRVFVGTKELRHDRFPVPDPAGYAMAVNFPQSETERLLLDAVDEEPLVDLRLGLTFRGLVQHETHVAAELVDERGDPVHVDAGYVAGCDGARSTVRKELDVRFEGHAHDDHYLIVDVRADLPFPDERRFVFHPPAGAGRTALIHPQPFSLWHLDFQVGHPPDLESEARDGTLDRRIRAVIGDHDYEVTWSTSYVFKQLMASRFSVGRCFLVGDAAHLYAPYGARGLNSGLADADNLAWKLGMVVTGQAAPALLATYGEERHAVARHHFSVTSDTAAFMAPTTRRGRWRRDLTLALATRVPAARRWVDAGHFYRPEPVAMSSLTVPDPIESRAAVKSGELMPDLPASLAREGHPLRLRAAYGLHPMVVDVPQPAGDHDDVEVTVHHLGGGLGPTRLPVRGRVARERVLGACQGGAALLVRPDGFVSRRLDRGPSGADGDVVAELADTACSLYGKEA